MSSASGIQLLYLHTYFNYAGVSVYSIILNIILYVICFFKLYLTKVFGHISSRLQTVLLKTKDELIYSKTLFLWFIHCNALGIVVYYYQTASFKISKEIRHIIIINILLKNTDSCISLKQYYFWLWRKPIKINCHRNFYIQI